MLNVMADRPEEERVVPDLSIAIVAGAIGRSGNTPHFHRVMDRSGNVGAYAPSNDDAHPVQSKLPTEIAKTVLAMVCDEDTTILNQREVWEGAEIVRLRAKAGGRLASHHLESLVTNRKKMQHEITGFLDRSGFRPAGI
jgi:hypothetical protein